jgi:cob(I)alamin adenosyltransferase
LPDEPVDNWVLMYINRLSDFLFVFSRLANQLEKVQDIEWIPQKR